MCSPQTLELILEPAFLGPHVPKLEEKEKSWNLRKNSDMI